MGNNAGGPIFFKRHLIQCMRYLRQIMPVNFTDRPSKRFPLGAKWFQIKHFFDSAETLDFVVIHDHDQIIKMMMRGK